MKICIYGAGAVGGQFAVRLAQAGEEISVIARGPHLNAIRKNGLKLLVEDKIIHVRLKATHDPHEAGLQDLVIVTVKGPSLAEVVDNIKPLLDDKTPIIFAMNGIPWWYFYGLDEPGKERRLDVLDPGNRWWDEIGPEKALGGVVYSSNILAEPGVIRNNSPKKNLLIIGEPNGSISERCEIIDTALNRTDLSVEVVEDIRNKIWTKLLGNIAFGPISSLTSCTSYDVSSDKVLRALAISIMRETVDIANALNAKLDLDPEERIDSGMKKMPHKPSMLQDFELGRPMEIPSILLTPQRFARMAGVPTPNLDIIISLVKMKAKKAGLFA